MDVVGPSTLATRAAQPGSLSASPAVFVSLPAKADAERLANCFLNLGSLILSWLRFLPTWSDSWLAKGRGDSDGVYNLKARGLYNSLAGAAVCCGM
eukprot:s6716_g5.t1